MKVGRPATAYLGLASAVSFWNRLRPPTLYWPELRFDELPGLLRIICGHEYDNGVVSCCRRYLRIVEFFEPSFLIQPCTSKIVEVASRYGTRRATPYAPASPRAQGDILLTHATVSSRPFSGGDQHGASNTQRLARSRAISDPEAGATSWASS